MSDEDRMDRAERIRDLREGRRMQTDTPAEADDADGDGDTAASSDGDAGTATSSDGDAAAGTDSDGDAVSDTEDAPALDDAVVETVERISEASASIPAAETLETAEATPTPTEDAAPARGEPDGDAATGSPGNGPDQPSEGTPSEAAGFAAAAESTAGHRGAADTRVLEFGLGGERYCIDIDYVEEIVKDEPVTRVPNTPEFVEGVVDLRGQITTILNPKLLLATEDTEPGDVLVVFEAEAVTEQGRLGWIVDDVHQVAPVVDEEVNDPPAAADYVNGVIDRGEDEPFVVWTSPEDALDSAT